METITAPLSLPGNSCPSSGHAPGRAHKRHPQDDAATSAQAAQFALLVAGLLPDPGIEIDTELSPGQQQPAAAAARTDGIAPSFAKHDASPSNGAIAAEVINADDVIEIAHDSIVAAPDGTMPDQSGHMAGRSPAVSVMTPLSLPGAVADGGAHATDDAGQVSAVRPFGLPMSADMDDLASATATARPSPDGAAADVTGTQQPGPSIPYSPQNASHATAPVAAAAVSATTAAAVTSASPVAATTGMAGLADEFASRVNQFEQAGGNWTGTARITFRSNVWNGASVHIAGSANMLAIVVTPPSLAQAGAVSILASASATGIVLRQEKQLAAELSRKLGRNISLHIADATGTEDGPHGMDSAAAHTET